MTNEKAMMAKLGDLVYRHAIDSTLSRLSAVVDRYNNAKRGSKEQNDAEIDLIGTACALGDAWKRALYGDYPPVARDFPRPMGVVKAERETKG